MKETHNLSNSIDDKKLWKHFFVFAAVSILLVLLANIVGQNASPGETTMKLLNRWAFIQVPLLLIVLIRSFKAKQLLTFLQKVNFLIGIELVLFLSTLVLNWINPFDRNISQQDLIDGMLLSLAFYGIMLLLCLPIAGFLKSRKIKD